MKKTVILSPYKKEFSGTATLSDDKVRFTVNHPPYTQNYRLKLYAMSTMRASVVPDTLVSKEMSGRCTELEADNSIAAKALGGCRADTYLITVCCGIAEEAVLAAFFGLEWNAARFLDGKQTEVSEPEYDTKDCTLDNAQSILDSMKKGNKADREVINGYINEYRHNIQSLEKHNLKSDSFNWYRVSAGRSVSSLSAVRHVLSGAQAKAAVAGAGYYIAGICNNDSRHIAIGIPGCHHICPLPQLTDCCVFEDGFHITGIFLGDDGQYFEKYLQNQK